MKNKKKEKNQLLHSVISQVVTCAVDDQIQKVIALQFRDGVVKDDLARRIEFLLHFDTYLHERLGCEQVEEKWIALENLVVGGNQQFLHHVLVQFHESVVFFLVPHSLLLFIILLQLDIRTTNETTGKRKKNKQQVQLTNLGIQSANISIF